MPSKVPHGVYIRRLIVGREVRRILGGGELPPRRLIGEAAWANLVGHFGDSWCFTYDELKEEARKAVAESGPRGSTSQEEDEAHCNWFFQRLRETAERENRWAAVAANETDYRALKPTRRDVHEIADEIRKQMPKRSKQELKRENNRNYFRRLRTDPVRYANWLKKKREWQRRQRLAEATA